MVADERIDGVLEDHPTLGKYVSHHPSQRGGLLIRGLVIYTVPVMLLNLLFINDESTVVSIILPVAFAAWALGVFWYIAHLWNREVILFEQGFTYREGSHLGIFPYVEIVALRQKVERIRFGFASYESYHYTLVTKELETLIINNLYSDIKTMGNRLERFITRERLPLVQEQLQAGIALDFGIWLSLSKSGLEYDGHELAWQAFKGYRAQGGQLIIQSDNNDNWATIPVHEIDNVLLLVALLKSHGDLAKQT